MITTEGSAGSISFVITARNYSDFVVPLLKAIATARRPDDEVIFLISEDHPETATFRPDWLRVIVIPDVSIYRLRSHIPAVCRREWVILFEDHVMIEAGTIAEIRALIRERPDLDFVTLVAKNLTSTGKWDWAIFLFTFALVWAPLDNPPSFAFVTSAVVRRALLGPSAPLQDGEWEFRTIPRIFRSGNKTYSNTLFIDHIKSKTFLMALINVYQSARSGAALQRRCGDRPRRILREGRYVFVKRPGDLMRAVASRKHELPPGTQARLHVLGLVHLIGYVLGLSFGGERAAYDLDYD